MAKLLPSLGDGLQHKESYGVGSPIGEARRTLLSSHNVSSHNVPDSERRLREILDALPAAVYTTDADGRVTMFNEAAATFAGRRPQLGTDTWCVTWKLYRPDGTPLPHDQCPMATALKERRPVRGLEGIAERPDGTRVYFIPYPTPLYDSSGAMVGAVNMLVDITDQKQAEETIARHRDEQAALFEFTDRLFRASVLTDVYDSALDAIRRSLGCERASVLLFDDAGAMRFVASAGLSEGYRRAVDGHSPWTHDSVDPQPICIDDVETSDLPEPLKATVKSEGIAATAFIPLVVEGKLVGKFMAYYEAPHAFSQADIDLAVTIARQLGFGIQRFRSDEERRRAEHASRLLVSIIETSGDAIVSKELDGIVTSWNHGAQRIFGYAAEEMIGKRVTGLIPDDRANEDLRMLERIRRGEGVEHYETVRRRKDGNLIDVSLTVSPVMADNVSGASIIVRDISERKLAEQRLRTVMHELSHRSKNLLSVIQAMAQQTAHRSPSTEHFLDHFNARIRGLASSHDLLVNQDWRGASLENLVRQQLLPFADGDADRIEITGPPIVVSPEAAQTIGLALHELATNASKYGALSGPAGKLAVQWTLEPANGAPRFRMTWRERGGPPVDPPEHSGFGRLLIERLTGDKLNATPVLMFAREGVTWTFDAAAADILATAGADSR
jgi:PAS domain S-box-containing protein